MARTLLHSLFDCFDFKYMFPLSRNLSEMQSSFSMLPAAPYT